MADRQRILHHSEGLYVGPAPSSGYHFANYAGWSNNDSTDFNFVKDLSAIYFQRGEAWESSNYEYYQPSSPVGAAVYESGIKDKNLNNFVRNENLIRKIDRLSSIEYSIIFPRTNISQVNKVGLVGRPVIESPEASLKFSYLINGVRNEHRLGLNVNFPMMFYPFSGQPFYPNNKVNLVSGLATDELDNRTGHHRGEAWGEEKFSGVSYPVFDASIQKTGEVLFDYNNRGERANRHCFPENWPNYPLTYRDKRNFFLHVSAEKNGEEKSIIQYSETTGTLWNTPMEAHPNSVVNECISFGDCQMKSYGVQASVGGLPIASVSYVGSQIETLNTASGKNIPALNPKDGREVTGTFIIPNSFENEGISVLRPGDMTIELEASNIGISTTGANIQSINFGFDLSRERMSSLGYRLPIDRPVNYPVVAKGSFSVVVDKMETGKMIDFIHEDKIINFSINVRTPECEFWKDSLVTGDFYPGVVPEQEYTAVNYTFNGAKVENISFGSSIGGERIAQISFTSELNPDNLDNGFFISGVINSQKIFNYWLFEHPSGEVSGDGVILTDEDGHPLISDMIPF
jgi:hypothetical protein